MRCTDEMMETANRSKLYVWHIVNPPNEGTVYPVDTPEAAVKLIKELADKDLKNPRIWGNAFGLLQWEGKSWEGDGWHEWYNEDETMNIDEYEQWLEEIR